MFAMRSTNIFSNSTDTEGPRSSLTALASFISDRLGKLVSAEHVYTGEYVGKSVIVRREVSHVGEVGSEEIANTLSEHRPPKFFTAKFTYTGWTSRH